VGAVQKLATVVIIGLVALATALTVYIAREPDRRDSEMTEQEQIAIEHGTDLYIQYCLQCHGPSGLGNAGNEENPRIGAPLNQDGAGIPEEDRLANFQSDNAADEALAEEFLHFRISNGAPADPRLDKQMPAFGNELNGEEINALVYMVMNVDWDYVYNKAVLTTGETVAEAECEENDGDGEFCDNIEEAPPLYPTAPPPADDEDEESATPEGATPAAEGEGSGEAVATIEAQDPYSWSVTEVTVKPGDTIAVIPSGGLQHDFSIDEFGIEEVLEPGADAVMITIPEDAEPGDYRFYCSVLGHAQSGMVGTLTVEAP